MGTAVIQASDSMTASIIIIIIIIIIIMTLFKEDNSIGQVQSSLRSSIKIHTFTIYKSEHQ